MTGRKPNISAWCLTALAAILAVGCLGLGIGTAYARYREASDGTLGVEAKKPAQVYLWAGTDPEGVYTPGTGVWVENEGNLELSFMVTNTQSEDRVPEDTQQFRVRLIGSLLAWEENSEGLLRLTYTHGEETETLEAQVQRILPDTPLHSQFGDGWIFTFPDENGEELCWTLEGGERSTVAMQLVLENGNVSTTSLLKLQVLGDMTSQ